MAKTIKEMAEAHAPIERNEDWNKTQKQILKQTSFECGANAVLEMIESCYDKNDSLCVIAHKVLSKIQELKGK